MYSNRTTQRLSCSMILVLVSVMVVLSPLSTSHALTWQDIAADLMSPACPGRTLLNCTSGQAEQWRELIRQKLAQGESKEQVMQYFIDMRGEEILAAPPKRGFALTAWLFPLFILLNGAGLIVILTCRWARKRPSIGQDNTPTPTNVPTVAQDSSDPYRERLQQELKDFTAYPR